MAATVMELYGSKVFNEHEMRERLPSSTYKSLKATIEKGQPLDLEVANVVASVMKRWAIEQGATHVSLDAQLLAGFQVCRTVWVAIAKGWVDAMEGSAWIIIVLIIEYHAHGSIIVSPPLGRVSES